MPAQLAMAFRFDNGILVDKNCETSVVYMEQAARLATEYVDRMYGLDTLEKEKLTLLGPYVLNDQNLLIDRMYKANTYSLDVIDLLDL